MFDNKKLQLPFLSLLLLLGLGFTIVLLLPFFTEIFIALVGAVVLYPLYHRLTLYFKGKKSIAALCMVVLMILFIVGPLSIIGLQIFNESQNLYTSLQGQTTNVSELVAVVEGKLESYIPGLAFDLNVQEYAARLFSWVGGNLGGVLAGTLGTLFGIILVVLGLFFFLRDGEHFIKYLLALSPLEDSYDQKIIDRIATMINAVVRGALFIAIIQGALAGIGMAIFGVPNATLWGTLAAIGALLPGIGTGIVLLPAIIFLFITASVGKAVGLLLWGVVMVGLIDNILVPYFYGSTARIHPLLILLSVLGGLSVFGPVGFLLGPIIISLFLVVLEIYRTVVGSPEKKLT